jgi:hypothetical protein
MEDGGWLLACRRLHDPKNSPLPGALLQRTGQLFVSSDFFFPPSPEQPGRIQVEMPSLGNSHPWRKNHTATTITNINRSFIFVLLNLPCCNRRFMPRPSGYPVIFQSVSAASLSFVVRPTRVFRTFPLDEKQRRYALDPIIRSGFRGLIHIHLDHIRPPVVRLGDLFQNRRESPAGSAPRRPEIHQRRLVRLQHGRFKGVIIGMPNPLFRFHFFSSSRIRFIYRSAVRGIALIPVTAIPYAWIGSLSLIQINDRKLSRAFNRPSDPGHGGIALPKSLW